MTDHQHKDAHHKHRHKHEHEHDDTAAPNPSPYSTERPAEAQSTAATEQDQATIADLQQRIITLEQELVAAQQEAAKNLDVALRARAQADNTERHAATSIENARKFALDKFGQALVPVLDGLEHAQLNDESSSATLEGVRLTFKMFLDVMARFGIEQVNPLQQNFDPRTHEAVAMQPSADVEPGIVLQVLQKGYMLNGRVIRTAKVIVARESEILE